MRLYILSVHPGLKRLTPIASLIWLARPLQSLLKINPTSAFSGIAITSSYRTSDDDDGRPVSNACNGCFSKPIPNKDIGVKQD